MICQGDGIENAKVLLDGVQKGFTNGEGVYVLDNVTSGHYTIQVRHRTKARNSNICKT